MRAKGLGLVGVGAIIGAICGWLAWGGGGVALAQALTGIWLSHELEESYEISIGVDPSGKPRKEHPVDEIRLHYNIPQHYGNLVGVTGHGDSAVFWYQDAQGVIRNAILPSAASRLSRMELTPTTKYEEDVLP
jgi:hypothetical protein